tara:strand:- start:2709 stop:2921 length:213 start_codon:yes stop_codon:yes gene_type:complete
MGNLDVRLRFVGGEEENVELPREPIKGDIIELRKEEYAVAKVLLGEKGKFIVIINTNLKSKKPSMNLDLS